MKKKRRIAIVGSGHAALGACCVFTKFSELQIDVIDIGLTSPYPNQPNKPILNSKSCQGSFFPYGLNDPRWPVTLESRRMCSSHAYGGFSNVYSGAVLAPRTEDLVYWPKESIPLPQDYQFVLKHVCVIGAEDLLERWSPLVPPAAGKVHVYEVGGQAEAVLGFSRIAVRLGDTGLQVTPFNTSLAFNIFRKHGKINYTNSTFVHKLIKTSNGVQVLATRGGAVTSHGDYDAVFLAAGCINTTGIAHRSCRSGLERRYQIHSATGFVQGFVGKGPESSPELELRRRNNLPELFLEVRNSDFSGLWSHTQISAVSRHVLETVAQRLPSLMVKQFSRFSDKFHLALTNVPSILHTPSVMTYSSVGTSNNSMLRDQLRIEEFIPTKEIKWRQAVRSAIRNNAEHLNMSYIPGSEWLGNVLRGNQLGGWHFGGTLAMSENDDATNPTCTPQGELRGLPGVFVVDSAAFPSIPGTTVALLTMVHASKVARHWAETHVI
jgi:hypothetical protein